MKRINFLDGLRGISILMVVFSHAIATNHFPTKFKSITSIFFDGGLGVRCFFVLSGFLITNLLIYETRQNGTISYRNFYVKRAFRIIPVYFLYVITIFIIDNFNNSVNLDYSSYLQALSFTTGLWGKGSWLLGHTWSLAIEEQFYFIWPLLFFFTKKKKLNMVLLTIIIVIPFIRAVSYSMEGRFDYSFMTQGDAIAMGCLAALNFKTIFKQQFFSKKIVLYLSILLIFFIKIPQYYKVWGFLTVPFTASVQSICIAYLILYLIEHQRTTPIYQILEWPPLVWLGKLSYSWYIWQQLFMVPGVNPIFTSLNFPINILVSLMAAVCSYYILEQFFMAYRTKFLVKKPITNAITS